MPDSPWECGFLVDKVPGARIKEIYVVEIIRHVNEFVDLLGVHDRGGFQVYDWNCKQIDVFNETAKPIMNSCLEGYNGEPYLHSQF